MTTQRLPNGDLAGAVDGAYAWYRLGVSLILASIGSLSLWAYVVVLPRVQAEFEIDRATASIPYTVMMVGFAIGSVIFGRMTDRYGITVPVIITAILQGIGFAGSSMTSSFWIFTILHGFLIGMGAAATFGPLVADISHWFARRRGIAVATAACGNYVAGSIGPPVVQYLAETDGWRSAYLGIAIFCVATMIPLALLLRRRAPHLSPGAGRGEGAQLLQIHLSPRVLQTLLAIAGLSCCVAMSMPQVHLVAYCADLGYGLARGAEMLSLMLFCGIFSRIGFGFLADYIGGVRTLLLGSICQGLALILFLPFDGMMSLYVISALFGLAQGGIVPCYAIIVREYLPANEAGQRVGIVIMATISGMALGGWLTGWIYDLTGSYQAAFLNGIAWNVLNASIMVMVLWRTRRPSGGLAAA